MDEVRAKCGNDENMGRLYKQALDLLTPGAKFTIGEFDPLIVLTFRETLLNQKQILRLNT